jgi:hypothetical protein
MDEEQARFNGSLADLAVDGHRYLGHGLVFSRREAP